MTQPYIPGAMAHRFAQLPEKQRKSVSQEVDRIFRRRTGIARPLVPGQDIELERQWLRIRDEVLIRRFQVAGERYHIDWAIHQVDRSRNLLEIDVEPPDLLQPAICKAMFRKGLVPDGATLTMEEFPEFARWRLEWSNTSAIVAELTPHFVSAILFSHMFQEGWQRRARRERIRRQIRELEGLVWEHTPKPEFGGRTPHDLLALLPGPYEIRGKGLLWVGKSSDWRTQGSPMYQFMPLTDNEDYNNDIRWFLEHGTDLVEAKDLQERHFNQIFRQKITAFASALSGQASMKIDPVKQKILEKFILPPGTPIKKSNDLIDALRRKYASSPTERRVQELASRPRDPIEVLGRSSKH